MTSLNRNSKVASVSQIFQFHIGFALFDEKSDGRAYRMGDSEYSTLVEGCPNLFLMRLFVIPCEFQVCPCPVETMIRQQERGTGHALSYRPGKIRESDSSFTSHTCRMSCTSTVWNIASTKRYCTCPQGTVQ